MKIASRMALASFVAMAACATPPSPPEHGAPIEPAAPATAVRVPASTEARMGDAPASATPATLPLLTDAVELDRAVPACFTFEGGDLKEVIALHPSGRFSTEHFRVGPAKGSFDETVVKKRWDRTADGRLTRFVFASNGGGHLHIVTPTRGAHGEVVSLVDDSSQDEMQLAWEGVFAAHATTSWNGANETFFMLGLVPMEPGAGRLAELVPDIRDLGGAAFTGKMTARSVRSGKATVDTVITFESGRPTELKGERLIPLSLAYEGDRMTKVTSQGRTSTLEYQSGRLVGVRPDEPGKQLKIEWSGDLVARLVSRGGNSTYTWTGCDGDPSRLIGVPRVKRSRLRSAAPFSCRYGDGEGRCRNYDAVARDLAQSLCEAKGGELDEAPCKTDGVKGICKSKKMTVMHRKTADPTEATDGCLGLWSIVDD